MAVEGEDLIAIDLSGDGTILNDLDEDCGGPITPHEIGVAVEDNSTATPSGEVKMLEESLAGSLEFEEEEESKDGSREESSSNSLCSSSGNDSSSIGRPVITYDSNYNED